MRIIRQKFFLGVGLALLLAAQAARAQEVRYFYDKLGRLIGVMDQQGRTAIYEYDAVGNILSIKRLDATGPVAITIVNPNKGRVGDQVEILGIGFSATPGDNQVVFNGIAAQILAATPQSLATRVPAGATTGPITVRTLLGSATSPEPFTVLNIAITVSPTQAAVLLRGQRQFTATVAGIADQGVTWSLEGNVAGLITPEGLYRAPATVPTPPTVVLRATSIPFPELFGEATVTIVSEPNRFADAAPVSVTFGPPPQGAITASPVSVTFGPPPPGTIVSPAVSIFFGIPPANVFAPAMSVANAPVITAILDPQSAPQGTTLTVTLTGDNFTGATALVFSFQGRPDPGLTVANLTVSAGGDRLTADVTIAATAPVGPRIVIVKTPSGNSTGANTGNNIFTVTAP